MPSNVPSVSCHVLYDNIQIAAGVLESRWVDVPYEIRAALGCKSPIVRWAWIQPGERILEQKVARFGGLAFLISDDPEFSLDRMHISIPNVLLFAIAGSHGT